jgi:hypothetical protein
MLLLCPGRELSLGTPPALRCLADSGLRVRDSSVEKQDNEEAAFMWIEAVKHR